jgi:hypothetical protein
MPHIDKMIESRYLKNSDLDGQDLDVTIEQVREEELRGDDGAIKKKWIVFFRGLERGLILNVTNTRRLAELCGSKLSEEWVGKRVRLYVTAVPFRGEEVDAIRIKAAPVESRSPAKANIADEVPF